MTRYKLDILVPIVVVILIPFLGSVQASQGVVANGADSAEHPKGLGYYETLSYSTFIFCAELYNALASTREREDLCRIVSLMMFRYWVDTRIAENTKSERVDAAIQQFYLSHFSKDRRARRLGIFEDPLFWPEGNESPYRPIPEALGDIDRTRYLQLMNDYLLFLRDRLEGSLIKGSLSIDKEAEGHVSLAPSEIHERGMLSEGKR